MAYTSPPAKAAGDPLLSADWNTYIKDNFQNHEGRLAAIEASAGSWTKGASQSIADSTITALTFPTSEDYDYGGWGLTVGNTTITVPAGAIPSGYTSILVRVDAAASSSGDADGRRILYIYKNGATTGAEGHMPTVGTTLTVNLLAGRDIVAVAGDVFTAMYYHTAGAAMDVTGGYLTIHRIGPAS